MNCLTYPKSDLYTKNMQNKILSIYGYYVKKVRKRTFDNISHWEVYKRVVGQDRTLIFRNRNQTC